MLTTFTEVLENIKEILTQYRGRVFELSKEKERIIKESVQKLEEEKIKQLREDLRNKSL